MNDSIVRLESIKIENFKNVSCGELNLVNRQEKFKASILGLYGQNGSGKTALIDVMSLLKCALCGIRIPAHFADYISVNSDFSTVQYKFSIKRKNSAEKYHVIYSFNLGKIENDSHNDNAELSKPVSQFVPLIFNEKLSLSVYKDGELLSQMQSLIDTSTKDVAFGPKTKYNILIGNKISKDNATDILVDKRLCHVMSKSFIFSNKLLSTIESCCTNNLYRFILKSLVSYGNFSLFVFDTASNAIISFNALPLSFCIQNKNSGTFGKLVIPFAGNGVIPKNAFSIVENVVNNMNIVLNQLVPGLTISIKKLGAEMMPNGEVGFRIQMLSLKNDKEIALRYESEGIKKIVAILQLLIVVYNNPSITVAIDELDAGIFEYLLGEILRIISEKGKGQLIFTSHNLRPLETLDKSFVAFTTTNPHKRYIRMTNIKKTNNLRDFYYRDITLGEQNEPIYEATNNHDIALAFKEAGDCCGS